MLGSFVEWQSLIRSEVTVPFFFFFPPFYDCIFGSVNPDSSGITSFHALVIHQLRNRVTVTEVVLKLNNPQSDLV